MPRRRTTLNVIALLAAGAAVNVAVAWGLAASVQISDMTSHGPLSDWEMAWLTNRYHFDLSEIDVVAYRQQRIGYNQFSVFLDGDRAPRDYEDVPIGPWMNRCGWPLFCVQAQSEYENDIAARRDAMWEWERSRSISIRDRYTGMWYIDGRVLGYSIDYQLPTQPLWPGFAINTVFYATVLWIVFTAPFALRRMIRRRRGQCARCAYPIGTSDVCPECGTPVQPRGNASRSDSG